MLRLTVRAKPNARSESVTAVGEHDGVPVLEVRVRAKAVDGAANDAIVAALATALGVRRSAVTIARGFTSRIKHVHIDAEADTAARLDGLRAECQK